mgnify:CR=1 FL=1
MLGQDTLVLVLVTEPRRSRYLTELKERGDRRVVYGSTVDRLEWTYISISSGNSPG